MVPMWEGKAVLHVLEEGVDALPHQYLPARPHGRLQAACVDGNYFSCWEWKSAKKHVWDNFLLCSVFIHPTIHITKSWHTVDDDDEQNSIEPLVDGFGDYLLLHTVRPRYSWRIRPEKCRECRGIVFFFFKQWLDSWKSDYTEQIRTQHNKGKSKRKGTNQQQGGERK